MLVKKNKIDLINKKRLNKKNIIITSLISTLSVIPVTSTIYFASTADQHYVINQQKMGFEAAFNKLKENAEIVEYDREIDAFWKIKLNGEELKFNNPVDLRKAVFDNILSSQRVFAPFGLDSKIDHNTGKLIITDQELSSLVSSNSNSKTVTVYKKNNDGLTLNENEGYQSYFSAHDAYLFNNIYFNSKTDLKKYLINDFLPNNEKDNFNTFVIQAPNGVKSNPISTKVSDAPKSAEYLKKFINANNEKVLSYTNKKTGEEIFLNKNNYLSSLNKINIKDLNYQHVYSNQGESRYVVDNIYTDDNNLIGPYFYEGNLDIGSFTNIDMWRKTNSIKKSVYVQSRIDSTIGLFFSSIINDDNVVLLKTAEANGKDPVIFNTPLVNSLGTSIDEQFLVDLGLLSPKLKQEVVETNKRLLMGKKYNTFYKLPIMYNFIMNRIVSWNLSNEVYETTINYFTKIANFIQDAIEVVILFNDNFLIGKDNKKFNALEFFNIGNPEYDINTSTEYFLNYFKSNYPKLVAAIAAFNGAQNNIFLTTGLIPFSGLDLSLLFDYHLITQVEFNNIYPNLKEIYDVYSTINYNDMATNYIKYAAKNNDDINVVSKLPESERITAFNKLITTNKSAEISLFLKSVGLKNTEQYLQNQSLLISELRLFFQQGLIIKGGFLSKIRGQKSERIVALVNYALKNPESDNIYRMYMALVIDQNSKLNIFHESMSTDTNAFIKAVSRIAFATLASSTAVGIVVKNMYTGFMSVPTLETHPLTDSIRRASISTDSQVFAASNDNDEKMYWSSSYTKEEIGLLLEPVFNAEERKWIFSHFPTISSTECDTIFNHWLNSINDPSINSDRALDLVEAISISSNSNQTQRIDFIQPSQKNKGKVTYKPFYKIQGPMIENDYIPWPNKPNGPNSWLAPGFEPVELVIPHPVREVWIRRVRTYELLDVVDREPIYEEIIHTTKKSKLNWLGNNISEAAEKGKDLFKFMGKYFFEILGGVFTIAEFAFVILDLLKVEEIQDFYVYTTIDGTEFIWDGGKTVSRFFGFENTIVNKLNQSDLLTPIQITLPQIEEFYYFNQIKYYDSTELKKGFVENKLFSTNNSQITNSNFKVLYTFDKIINNDLLSSYDTVEKLTDAVFNNLNIKKNTIDENTFSYDFSNISKSSRYISNTAFAFSNGITTDNANTLLVNAENVINHIRPTKIVKKIKKENDVIMDLDNSFHLPGITYKNGILIDNSKYVNDYIVDNSANELKEGASLSEIISENDFVEPNPKKAESKSISNLFNVFKQSFKLQIKNTSFVSWINANSFSKLSENKNEYIIYNVKPIGIMDSGLFLNLYDAEKYIYKYIHVTKVNTTVKDKFYRINNMNFYSSHEFENYVKTYSVI